MNRRSRLPSGTLDHSPLARVGLIDDRGMRRTSQHDISFAKVRLSGGRRCAGQADIILLETELPTLLESNGVAVVHKIDAVKMPFAET